MSVIFMALPAGLRVLSSKNFFAVVLMFLSNHSLAETLTPEQVASSLANVNFTIGNLWIMLAAILVFLMHLGFAALEAGSVQKKNVANILFKNTAIIAIGILTYALVGFNLMYPGADFAGSFMGFAGFGVDPGATGLTTTYNANYTYWSDFIFQAMFAATCATIVSGAVAERIKLESFLVFSAIFVALIYPVVGMWKWGGGFLDALSTPFYDFAGSTIVHSVGGWAALIGAIMIGPRIGKYAGKAMTASSPALVTIGAFLLWFGWFGFNGGSVLSADAATVSLVFVTTAMGAAAGTFAAMIVDRLVSKHFNLANVLNGMLGGLVGITAGADMFSVMDAVIVGAIGGAVVVLAIQLMDKFMVDDPVGAISVHLVGGIWGTLAVGMFGQLASMQQLLSQAIGVVAVGLFTTISSGVLFGVIDKIMGLRVSEKAEIEGLDIHEHEIDISAVKEPVLAPSGGK